MGMTVEELIAELHKIPAEQRQFPVAFDLQEDDEVEFIEEVEVDVKSGTVFLNGGDFDE